MEYPLSLTVNGLTLRGMAHKPEIKGQSACPVVILFHGFTGSKTEGKSLFVRYARELLKNGIGTIRFDFSGSGESDGLFSNMTFSQEVYEAKEIFKMVQTLEWVDPDKIMLTGFSMGGAIAAQVAKEYPNRIHKLCLWSPAGNMNQIACSYFEKSPKLPNGNMDIGGLELSRSFYEDLKDRNLYEGISIYQNPVLIIHGTNDQSVPYIFGQKYAEVFVNNRVRIHLIQDADHVFSRLGWIEELFELSVQFLSE
ncbi:hypothetical protein SAMN05877753_104221 [Bacillus oleivorans]|uniref:Serine aminopeptidase S33 domain-containing protein n=1 Tax=Bacillus oleivorans TaxID=1448271 RepID=A0A285CSW9_9BACI|nr:alpha/beta fold hydrolase [Bacillus oleivorans]SNX70641.1 hypothetical protein SAMN05877753_104221 [Bacillus oleivorans]